MSLQARFEESKAAIAERFSGGGSTVEMQEELVHLEATLAQKRFGLATLLLSCIIRKQACALSEKRYASCCRGHLEGLREKGVGMDGNFLVSLEAKNLTAVHRAFGFTGAQSHSRCNLSL